MSENDAALYEAPFEYVKEKVNLSRINNSAPDGERNTGGCMAILRLEMRTRTCHSIQRYIGTVAR